MSEKKKPVLSISLLVSNNRRDTIEKCMESLLPLREAVPSELIIVDTGCTDGSVDIARKYADKVVQFTWCNDFAAARNAGLCECTGEWFLYLDDDEWFGDVSELIAFFQSEERKRCDTVWYLQRNYDDFSGTTYVDTYVGRIVKLTPETRFCGKIHEWLEPLPRLIKETKSYVHHYGYVFKTEEDRLKHLERNLTLEEEAVKENPNDIRMCCQLVQEYRIARRFEEAEALSRTTLENTEYEITNSFVQYLLSVIPRIYMEHQEYEKAIEEFERLEREERLLHQTKLAICYEKAVIFGALKQDERQLEACKAYLAEYKTLPKVGEPVEFPVMDFARYHSELLYQNIVSYGIKSMMRLKEYADAEVLFKNVIWTGDKKTASELLVLLLKCYVESGNETLLKQYIPKVIVIEELEKLVYGTLHSMYEKYPEKRQKLLADLEKLNLRSGNFAFFHLLYTEGNGCTTSKDLAEYYEKSDRKYDTELVAVLFGNVTLFPTILEQTSIEVYKEALSVLLAEKDATAVELLWQKLPSYMACYPEEKKTFLLYATMVIAEKRVVFGANQQAEVERCLDEYLSAVRQYAEAIYRPELFSVNRAAVLPANIRFMVAMEQARAEMTDFARWGEGIKRAAKEYPAMLPVVKALLETKKNSGNVQMPTSEAQAELLALAEQLKSMVRAQLAEGKTEEARAILLELVEMLPEDEEVKEMLGKI